MAWCATLAPSAWATSGAIARALRDRDQAALKAALVAGGYLPNSWADAVDADFALRLIRRATRWYAVPGEHRFSANQGRRRRDDERRDSEQRAAIKTQMHQFTVPPESILIRRMHGIIAIVLEQLRAGADWGALAAEYRHDATPATPLGQAEADFVARHG